MGCDLVLKGVGDLKESFLVRASVVGLGEKE